jgi:hypothetical protein
VAPEIEPERTTGLQRQFPTGNCPSTTIFIAASARRSTPRWSAPGTTARWQPLGPRASSADTGAHRPGLATVALQRIEVAHRREVRHAHRLAPATPPTIRDRPAAQQPARPARSVPWAERRLAAMTRALLVHAVVHRTALRRVTGRTHVRERFEVRTRGVIPHRDQVSAAMACSPCRPVDQLAGALHRPLVGQRRCAAAWRCCTRRHP